MPSPEIIAEIGSAHHGNIDHARRLVAAVADAGADCCKTQIIFAHEIIHQRTDAVVNNHTPVDLYARLKSLERPYSFYKNIRQFCDNANIAFLPSVFGDKSLAIAMELRCARIKIASAELNHCPLLRAVARATCDVILSTGVSTLADIEMALDIIPVRRCALLHCVTAYPAPTHEYNLRLINTLGAIFGAPVGVSDHSPDPYLVPLLATVLRAAIIEKHIVLERSATDLDDCVAIVPKQLRELCVRAHHAARHPEDAMQALREQYSEPEIAATLGDGIKRCAPSEQRNYETTNRSIRALTTIRAGDRLSTQNCAILRGETLGGGLSPYLWSAIEGAIAGYTIEAGYGIQWEHLLPAQ